VLVARSRDKLDALAEELAAAGGHADVLATDPAGTSWPTPRAVGM
jgi:short-subunit dehydrogenase